MYDREVLIVQQQYQKGKDNNDIDDELKVINREWRIEERSSKIQISFR